MRHHLSACRWLGLARFAVLATVVLGLALPMRASAETVLKFGVASVNEGLLPVRVANDQGLFKAEGIAVEFLDFRGGGPTVQAFAAGSVDFCICAADHVLRLANRGLDARIIVGLDEHHSYALLAKADSPYTDIKSLKGKSIGITSPGSFTDNTVRWAIKQAGLQAERDFQIVGAGGGASMRAAIETGQVDAGAVVTTEVADYLRSGKFKIVTDWRRDRQRTGPRRRQGRALDPDRLGGDCKQRQAAVPQLQRCPNPRGRGSGQAAALNRRQCLPGRLRDHAGGRALVRSLAEEG